MVGHLTPTDPVFTQRLAAAQHALAQHTDPVTATHQAYAADLQACSTRRRICGRLWTRSGFSG